jgi:hypothetical protein
MRKTEAVVHQVIGVERQGENFEHQRNGDKQVITVNSEQLWPF